MSRRAARALVLTAPLLLGLAATPAWATGSVSSPGDGAPYSSNTTVAVRASASSSGTTNLSLVDPSGRSQLVASYKAPAVGGSPTTLAYDLRTDCWTYPSKDCSGYVPAPNGAWTVKVDGGADSHFSLRVPPATPSGFTAKGSGTRRLDLAWTRGVEPDLTTYTLYDGSSVLQDGIDPGSACNGTACALAYTYGGDAPGNHDLALTSHRRTSPAGGETVESGKATASATLETPPPAPAPTASAGSGSSGGSTGSGSSGAGSSGTGSSGTGSSGAGAGATGSGSSGSGPSGKGSTGMGSTGTGSTGTGSTGTGSGGTGSSGSGASSSGTGAKGTSGSTTTAAGAPRAATFPSSVSAVIASRRSFATTFNAFAPSLGIAKLPPLPQTSSPAFASAGEAALPFGTYQPSLPYKPVVAQQPAASRSAVRRVSSAVSTALDSAQLVRSLAAGLLLLLAGAHLRRFLATESKD